MQTRCSEVYISDPKIRKVSPRGIHKRDSLPCKEQWVSWTMVVPRGCILWHSWWSKLRAGDVRGIKKEKTAWSIIHTCSRPGQGNEWLSSQQGRTAFISSGFKRWSDRHKCTQTSTYAHTLWIPWLAPNFRPLQAQLPLCGLAPGGWSLTGRRSWVPSDTSLPGWVRRDSLYRQWCDLNWLHTCCLEPENRILHQGRTSKPNPFTV